MGKKAGATSTLNRRPRIVTGSAAPRSELGSVVVATRPRQIHRFGAGPMREIHRNA